MISGAPRGRDSGQTKSVPGDDSTGLGRVGPRVDSSRAVPTGPAGRRHHCTGPRQRRAVPGTLASDGPRVRACCAAVPCALMAAPPSCRCAESASSCAGGWVCSIRRAPPVPGGRRRRVLCLVSCRFTSPVCVGRVRRSAKVRGLSAGRVWGELQLAPRTRLQLRTLISCESFSLL